MHEMITLPPPPRHIWYNSCLGTASLKAASLNSSTKKKKYIYPESIELTGDVHFKNNFTKRNQEKKEAITSPAHEKKAISKRSAIEISS